MLFTSTVFLFLFFPIVILIYYNPFFKGRVFKNIFLLISSFLFYAWGEPVFIFLIMISTIVTWYIGRLIENCGGGGV